jgi:hypothetical protein
LYSKYFFFVTLILLILLIVLVFVEFVSFSFVGKIFSKPHLIEIQDECSLIMGNLVHQIRDENDCSLRCHNECYLDESNYIESIFFQEEGNACHSCDCYCK